MVIQWGAKKQVIRIRFAAILEFVIQIFITTLSIENYLLRSGGLKYYLVFTSFDMVIKYF